MKKDLYHFNKGFSLIEVVLSVALFSLFITSLSGMYLYGTESTMLSGNRARAVMLAEEGIEALRNIRDPGYNNLVNGNYGLNIVGNEYNLIPTSDSDGFFTRIINVSEIDSKRKDITSTVTWQQNNQREGSVSIISRLSNWIASGILTGHMFIYEMVQIYLNLEYIIMKQTHLVMNILH